MNHDGDMRTPALVIGAAVAIAACGGSDDASDTTLTEITLLTTTTTAPPFVPETTDGAVETTLAPTTVAETTTVPPTTEAVAETTTTEPAPASPFSIEPDGIGAAAFGAAPDGVIDFVSSVLGAPNSDTGWIDPFEIGPCPGTQLRLVAWGDLALEFGDVSNITEGRQHFYGYYYGNEQTPTAVPPGLVTESGLTVGSSVAALLDAHPDADLFAGDEFLGPNFIINDALRGTLTGLADTDVITSFAGGLPCNG